MISVADLNAMSLEEFVAAVGVAFEGSPWVAEIAYEERPFSSAADLHEIMLTVVAESTHDERLALISAHPDLGSRSGAVSDASHEEQASAGLDRLDDSDAASLRELNAAYKERFGFPFILCAREHSRASVVSELRRRLDGEHAVEVTTALEEIGKIARLRLAGIIQ